MLRKKVSQRCWLVASLFLVPLLSDLTWAKPKHDDKEILPKQTKQEGVKRHGPPPWAPAHGYRRKFLYYPNQGIYYNAQKKQYFWVEAGAIKVGVKLPKGIRVGEEGVTVELPREMPELKDFKK